MPQQGLTRGEIHRVVNLYIGVNAGYLGDFTYRSHHDFYVELDLDINPYPYDGTTRERFIQILSEAKPDVQARILHGILDRYPVDSSEIRTAKRFAEIEARIGRLEGLPSVASPEPSITSEVVDRAISDAEALIKSTGATSGVDRIHTALHGYLRAVCHDVSIPYDGQATLNQLFRLLRNSHPAFRTLGPREQDIQTILRSFNAILDAMNPLRNRASVAHPNETLLDEAEAILVINAARTVLHYLDARIAITV
jgi:hypothetical protein